MGKLKIKRPRGTRDFAPQEMYARKQVEGILRRAAETFGYGEIATPTFEHLSLFTMKSGEQIVEQLYTFEDKGKRVMALRPELTAAVMRFFSEEMAYNPKPVKVFYFGNCFRYERPQKGRYREFWQFGAECIGPSGPEAIAEIVALAHHCIRATGLQGFVLRIGHLRVLQKVLQEVGANDKSAMTLIDKGNIDGLREYFIEQGIRNYEALLDLIELKGEKDALKKAREINKMLKQETGGLRNAAEGLNSLERISGLLDSAGIEHIIDFGIARGLDYYSGMVFEVDVPSLGAEKQICGGGEYNLNEIFSLDLKGTSGFAIGFDRLLMALEHEGVKFTMPSPKVGIIPTPGTEEVAFSLSTRLRGTGVGTELEIMGRGLKKALSRMNELRVRFAIITGERELKEGNVVLRNMTTGEQEEVPLKSVVSLVEERIFGGEKG